MKALWLDMRPTLQYCGTTALTFLACWALQVWIAEPLQDILQFLVLALWFVFGVIPELRDLARRFLEVISRLL